MKKDQIYLVLNFYFFKWNPLGNIYLWLVTFILHQADRF